MGLEVVLVHTECLSFIVPCLIHTVISSRCSMERKVVPGCHCGNAGADMQLNFFHQDSESFRIFLGVLVRQWSCCVSLSCMLAKMAVSNTSFRFFWVRAEHSVNVTALICCAHTRASSTETGCSWLWASRIRMCTFSRRSDCVPTRTMGTSGHRR